MKFALNYSEPASILLRDKKIQIDLFKAPDWPELIPLVIEQHPTYIHFSLSTCDGSIPTANYAFIENSLKSTATEYVNVHLNAPRDLNPSDAGAVQNAIAMMYKEVNLLSTRLGAENIVIENCPMPLIGYDFNHPAVQSSTITSIVEENGCGFLLDISHARISASTNDWNIYEYINQLPLSRLVELHVTGIKLHEGVMTDHFELTENDWQFTNWAASQINTQIWPQPRVVAFEYGGLGPVFAFRNNIEVIASQVPQLYKLFSSSARLSID